MPRPLVFGNGRLLVQCDHRGNIRDFAWPIGIWNHLSGRAVRIGVWAEGGFSWLDSARWERSHLYELVDPLVGVETHDSPELGVRIEIKSWIPKHEGESFSPPTSDTFRRLVTIHNPASPSLPTSRALGATPKTASSAETRLPKAPSTQLCARAFASNRMVHLC